MRESSIFYPLLDIEDFGSMEDDFGPKKCKALDEVIIGPNPTSFPVSIIKDQSQSNGSPVETEPHPLPSKIEHQLFSNLLVAKNFSSGSSEVTSMKRKRWRSSASGLVKSNPQAHSPKPRTRGWSTKAFTSFSVKPQPLNRKSKGSVKKRQLGH
uniref:Uncharacterized protein n=1 Tax=Cannabis sativa TaxID=3483 RepID=A0A803Q032_CANSA